MALSAPTALVLGYAMGPGSAAAELIAAINATTANNTGVNALTAFATGGQASATALTGGQNRITVCATIGDSVKLPVSVAGLQVVVINNGAAACDVFPQTGDKINALTANLAIRVGVGSTATFFCPIATQWSMGQIPLPPSKFTLNAGAGPLTASAGDLTGAATVYAQYSGVNASTLTVRTATQMFNDMPNVQPGDSYLLQIINTAAGTATLTTAAGVTLTGTMTIATNTTRTFVVTFTTAIALVIQSVGVGTIS